MKSFEEALKKWDWEATDELSPSYRSFKFGDGYELTIEPLMFDEQFYIALYKDKQLVEGFEKVVIKKGKV